MLQPVTRPSHYEQELAALDDACRLAELWEAALRASFQLRYDNGYQRGVRARRDEESTVWQEIVTGYSAVLKAPTRAELDRVRLPSNNPCTPRCGRCSRCIRAAAAVRNLARYGRQDFPGCRGAGEKRS